MMSLHGSAKKCLAPTTLRKSEMDCPSVVLSLAYCPMDAEINSINCCKKNTSSPASDAVQETTMKEAMEGDSSTKHNQDNEVDSAVTEEFTPSIMGFSENGRQLELEEGQFKDSILVRSKGKNVQRLVTLGGGINVVPESAGESDGFEDLRGYSLISLQQPSKLQSSQYKGVVPQPNGRWGAQIYEKHERVWLGTFNKEEDAAIAYDRAALKFRGRDAMTNFSPAPGGNPEARFMTEHTKEEIVGMLRKHSYDEEFEHNSKRIMMTAARPASTNNEEAGSEGSGKRETETKWPDDGNGNSGMAALLLREQLFEKAVTPSDVGKLNRLVIPKLHAEKYFPLVRYSSEKGSLLNFEDNSGKIWRFRYSYWKSSQSYVLTKGWNRFVKDKNLKVGDFVSFHRGSSEPRQLYISWRNRPSGRPQLSVGRQSRQSKAEFVHQGSLSSNSFNSGTEATVVGNALWLPIVCPRSSNSAAFTHFKSNYILPLVNKVGNFDHLCSHTPETSLDGDFTFCFSDPARQTDQDSFRDINTHELPTIGLYFNLHNSLNSGDRSTNIKPLHPFVNPSQPSAAQELEAPEHKATWSLDPATKQGVRLFGVSLTES